MSVREITAGPLIKFSTREWNATGEVDPSATVPRMTKRLVAPYVERAYRTAVFPCPHSSVPAP